MLLETLSQKWRVARSVNQTSAAFVAKIPTITEPTGDAGTATGASVIELSKDGQYSQNAVMLLAYGTNADENTLSSRVIGWRYVGTADDLGANRLWIPVLLAELLWTTGTASGAVGGVLVANQLFADTVSITTGNANVSVEILSPTNNLIAWAIVDLKGFQKLEISFQTGGSATDCNALLALL
jgi:hypothetical protein